jgi:hypothetical protein
MVKHSPFTGKEDPNLHLQAFVQLCQTFYEDGVTQDQMRARLFLFSLLGKALHWFHTLPVESQTRLGCVDEGLHEGILFANQDSEFAQQE